MFTGFERVLAKISEVSPPEGSAPCRSVWPDNFSIGSWEEIGEQEDVFLSGGSPGGDPED